MTKVKGSGLQPIPILIKEKFGEKGYQRWLKAINPTAREIYRGVILASQWFPIKEAYIEPVIKINELFYNGKVEGSRIGGAYSAEKTLTGIYKIFVKVGSPDFLINRASRIFSTYFNPGELKVVNSGKGQATIHVFDFPEINQVIEYRIWGFMEKALEISGCKNVKVRMTKSLTKRDPVTEFKITWN